MNSFEEYEEYVRCSCGWKGSVRGENGPKRKTYEGLYSDYDECFCPECNNQLYYYIDYKGKRKQL